MKTKKELLKFFLEEIEIWDSFSLDLAAQLWLPKWNELDDDLSNLFKELRFIDKHKNDYVLKGAIDMLIVCQIENPTFIPQLLHEDIISPAKFKYALFELYKFADIPGYDMSWQQIRAKTSVIDIVDKVYNLQQMF